MRSVASNARMKEEAKLTELKEQATMMKRKQNIEERELQLRKEKEAVGLQA